MRVLEDAYFLFRLLQSRAYPSLIPEVAMDHRAQQAISRRHTRILRHEGTLLHFNRGQLSVRERAQRALLYGISLR